jgi:hypothetical protein
VKALLVALCLLAAPLAAPLAQAQESDGVTSTGRLSDEDFFRLVTCGAKPGGPCRGDSPRWAKRRLTLTLAMGDEPAPAGFEARLQAAIDHAITQINGVGARITIVQTDRRSADITIRPTALTEGAKLKEVPGVSAAGIMGVGYVSLWWDDSERITDASILISTSITNRDLKSVMLEEITQSLGALYDIENPAYEGVSILSQNSNATTTLKGQDAALLRWLYPPKD